MLTILVNGDPFPVDVRSVRTMADLVELVKANIDPEFIITDMALGGQTLTDSDWRLPLVAQGEKTLEFVTGSKGQYVEERLSLVVPYLENIEAQFAFARTYFQSGVVTTANTSLSKALSDLRAFIDWYATLLELMPENAGSEKQALFQEIKDLTTTSELMLQQSMRQLWSVVALTIENKLEPQLSQFRARCAKFRLQ